MKWISLFLTFILTSGLFPQFPPLAPVPKAEVSAQVWQDLASGQPADLIVTLRQRADVQSAAAAARAAGEDPDIRVVQALQQTALESQVGLLTDLKAQGVPHTSYWIVNMVRLRASAALVGALANRPDVQRIDSDRTFSVGLESPASAPASQPSALAASIQPNLTQVQAPMLWALGYTGQGIVYGNADTGVQWDHPALKGEYRGWNGTTADHNYSWWDAIHASDTWTSGIAYNNCPTDMTTPCDDFGHGTHTTGTGVGLDSGSGLHIGVAPGAKWIACRNMFGTAGIGRPTTYAECLEFMMAPWPLNSTAPYTNGDPSKHANIISNSYTCPSLELCPSDLFADAAAAVRAAGIFMSASAGNGNPTCGSILDPPAVYPTVFTVGAVDSNSTIAGFSLRGPVTYNNVSRTGPDLVAPGVGILSSYPGNNYTSLSGTSMSAPHVAGAVALIWSAYPTLRGDVPGTEALLKSTASVLFPQTLCGEDIPFAHPNNTYGWGLLQIAAAYLREMPPRLYLPILHTP